MEIPYNQGDESLKKEHREEDVSKSNEDLEKEESRIVRKVAWRLIPFVGFLYVIAYLNRINVGFAALTMNEDLGFGPTIYSLGAGIFFIGYFILQIPSNLILERVGARRWIAPIAVAWGLLSAATMFVRTPLQFYLIRFFLGLAEAGFFPGIMLYFTYWFPSRVRTRTSSLFLLAIPISVVIGGPISGGLLRMDGILGLEGWQWLFLLEGLPASFMGILVWKYLPDRPAEASWLTAKEKSLLLSKLVSEQVTREIEKEEKPDISDKAVALEVFRSRSVWELSFIHLTIVTGLYGITLWIPEIIRSLSGANNLTASLLSAIPYLFAGIAMLLVSTSSDRKGEYRWHFAASAFVGGLGLLLSSIFQNPFLQLVSLVIASIGILSALGPFWALPTAYIRGVSLAGGIALVNAMGNLGGFLGPTVMGFGVSITQSFSGGLIALAIMVGISGILTLRLK